MMRLCNSDSADSANSASSISEDIIKDVFSLSPIRRVSMVLQLLARLFTSQPRLPTFDELPPFRDMPGCGWIWGEDDQLGTVNLLSDEVVRRASREEIRYAGTTHWRSCCYPFSMRCFPTGLGRQSPSIGSSLELFPPGRLLRIG